MDKLGYTLTSLREQKQRKGRNNSLVWESGSLQTIVLSSPVPYSAWTLKKSYKLNKKKSLSR